MGPLYIFLLAALALVSSKSFPSEISDLPDTCSNLSFACQDLHIARKCKAITPCIEIWESINVPKDNNEICDVCLEMVKEARDQLLSNETQEELKEVFEGSCNLLPIKAIASECRNIVDEIVPELIEMLASRMDPNQVCSVAGLCNNGLMKSLIKKQYISAKPLSIPDLKNPGKCKTCVKGMTFVRKALKFIPENDFTALLLHSCLEEFQGNHAQCTSFVNSLLPLYKYALQTDEVSLCAPLGRCKAFLPGASKEECQMCIKFVGAARKIPQSDLALEGVKNYSLGICEHITSDDQSRLECENLIHRNFNSVIQLLWTNQDPKTVCSRPCGTQTKNVAVLKSPAIEGAKVCAVCEKVVKDIKNYTKDLIVKNEVQKELSALCNKLGNFQNLCQLFMDNYFEMVYDTIVNSVKPDGLCKVLRMCSSNSTDELCSICSVQKSFGKDVNDKVAQNIKAALDKGMHGLCQPDFDLFDCDAFVKQAAPIVYNFLRVGDPSVFCRHMEHCPALSIPPPTFGDNMTCEFCEDLVQYVKNIVSSKSTEEEFRTAFQNMCKDLKEFSSECSNLVNEYFDQFYDFLVKNLDAQAVCSTLGLCDNSAVRGRIMLQISPVKPVAPILLSKSEERQKMLQTNRPVDIPATKLMKSSSRYKAVKIQPAQRISGIEVEESHNTKDRKLHRIPLTKVVESNSIEALPIGGPNAFVHNDIECSLCKAAVMYLEQGLESNKSEERIRKALDSVCKLFPTELNDQCQDFVNEYTEMFVTLIIQEFDPNSICAIIKVCSVEDAKLPRDFNEEYFEGSKVNFVQCEFCKKIMEYIENYIGNNKTEAQIKSALEKVCSELPATYSDRCKAFVDEYADIIITLLTKEVAPTMVCTALGLCPLEKAKGGGEVECAVCQYVLHFLQNQLMENSTEEAIKAAVEGVCEKLPKSLADNCEAFIEEYGGSLIVLLAQKLDPSIICVDLKLCQTQKTKDVVQPKIKLPKIGKCDTCEMVVNYMDKILENDDVDSEITKLVEKVCTILPMSTREECASIIDLYGPYILQMIGQVTDSKAVCQAIDLCSRSEKVQLVGTEKCTYGPSYWCQSTVHATACNAHVYCRQKVWKI